MREHVIGLGKEAQRIGVMLLAIALVIGLAPRLAWADDIDVDTLTVALTIVDTTAADDGVVCNDAVEVASGSTVADLLTAAGFTQGTQDESAADTTGKTYYDSYGSPGFLGKGWDESTYCYWVTMCEGSSLNYADAQLASTLANGYHYQYIYTNEDTFTYSDVIPDPLEAENADGDGGNDGNNDDDDDGITDDSNDSGANAYSADDMATLLANLSSRFAEDGSDSALTSSTVYAAIALNALGQGNSVDTDTLMDSLDSYEETYGYSITAGTLAKYLMALTAGGIDCTAIETDDGTRDLVAEMEALVTESLDVYSAVFVLAVYDYGSYEQGTCALTIDDMVSLILASADDDGLFGNTAYGCDTETTAQAILALLPYDDDADVSAAIEKAAQALLALRNDDGGFGYSTAYPESNIDATACVIAALTALGYDAAAGEALTTSIGSTPVGYLLAMADEDLAGYNGNSSYDEPMTSATVFLALAAVQGYQSTGEAFNVYDLQAVSDTDDDEGAGAVEDAEETAAANGGTSSVDTGDSVPYGAVTLLFIAAAAAIAARRLRMNRDFDR